MATECSSNSYCAKDVEKVNTLIDKYKKKGSLQDILFKIMCENDLSEADLERMLNYTKGTVCKWLKGGNMSLDSLKLLIDIFQKIPIDDFLDVALPELGIRRVGRQIGLSYDDIDYVLTELGFPQQAESAISYKKNKRHK